MDFIEELTWRGMLHQLTPGVEEALKEGVVSAYIGFDPTAPSLTIGNYVQVMVLSLFQRCGHQPVVLMGGATGRIGDPSGKDKERVLKSFDELDANLERQAKSFYKFLDFENGETKALMFNNLDFYKNMNVLDFLRDVGKNLTVNYMMSKDSVKTRLETGLSFTEFSYQLLQAYDFQCLYKDHGVTFQMGGSDQWGNITSGTEFIRKNVKDSKAFAITSQLLKKADGKKFGKSEEGNIWLDRNMTSPYKFYQFWLNAADDDLPTLMRYFTFKTKEEVEALESEHADNPQALKKELAKELTIRVHSEEDYEAVKKVTELLFNKNASKETLMELDSDALATVAEEIPNFTIKKESLTSGVNIIDLLAEHTTIVNSKGDARRAIKGNAISVNKDKISDFEQAFTKEVLLHDKYLMVENGKKNKFILIAE